MISGPTQWILDGHTPVPIRDPLEWGEWFERADRRIDWTEIHTAGADRITISTVFIGLGFSLDGGPPLLFETMVFGGRADNWRWSYATWDAAAAGHKIIVERLKRGGALPGDEETPNQ